MRTLLHRVRFLDERAAALSRTLDDATSNPLRAKGREPLAPRGWLVLELGITLGLLDEALRAYRYFWPDGSELVDSITRRTRQEFLPRSDIDLEDVHREFMSRLTRIHQSLADQTDPETLLGRVIEWRQLKAALRVPWLYRGDWDGLLLIPGGALQDAIDKLEPCETGRLRNALRCFRANEWLYAQAIAKATPEDYDPYAYAPIFSTIRQTQRGSPMRVGSLLRELRETYDINNDLADVVGSVLHRIEEWILTDGYEGLFDILDAEGNLLGRGAGGEPSYNVIPSEKRGPCRHLLVAFAKPGRSTSKTAAVATLREVRRHLITCKGTTRIILFFAPLGDIEKALEDSAVDLKAHIDAQTLSVFVPIAVYQNRLSIIAWRD